MKEINFGALLPPNPEQPPAPLPQEQNRRRRISPDTCKAIAVAVLLNVGLQVGIRELVTHGDKVKPTPLGAVCEPPSTENLQAVNRVFSLPAKPSAIAARQSKRNKIHKRVKKLDATTVTTMEQAEDFIASAETMMKPNKITVAFGEAGHDGTVMINGKVTLANKLSRRALATTAAGVAALPADYVQLSGLKRIVLYNDPKSEAGAFVMNRNLDKRGAGDMYINTAFEQEVDTADHEIGHLVDAVECGAADPFNDPGFAALNTKLPELSGDKSLYNMNQAMVDEHTAESLTLPRDLDRFYKQKYAAVERHDNDGFYKLFNADAKRIADIYSISAYSLKTVVEDKAEVDSMLGYQETSTPALSPHTPVVYAKFMYMMARLYKQDPAIVQEFADSMLRPRPFFDYANFDRSYYDHAIAQAKRPYYGPRPFHRK